MVTQQILQGHWNEIKGKVRERWGQISENDLAALDGNVEQLIGLIQRETGEARNAVENFLDDVSRDVSSAFEKFSGSARQYAHQAADRFHGASEKVRHGYSEAESLVQRRPAESVLAAFGVGLIAGTVIGLVLRSK